MQTTATLAADFDTDPRTLRKFLRSQGQGVGKGARYALPTAKREISAMRKKFIEWDAARTAPATDDAPITDDAPADADA